MKVNNFGSVPTGVGGGSSSGGGGGGGGGGTGGTASGDLSGTYPGPTVVGIGGIPVDVSGTTDGNILTYVAANADIELKSPNYTATAGLVPYYIAAGDTYTVPLYKQALFSDTIEVDGILVVLGRLIGVD